MTKKRVSVSDLLKQEMNPENTATEPVKTDSESSSTSIAEVELEKQVKNLENELDTLKKEFNNQQTTLKKKEQEIQGLQTQQTQLKDQQKTDQDKIASLTAQLQDYQQLDTDLKEKEQLITTLYSKLQQLEEEAEKKVKPKSSLTYRQTPSRPITRYVAPTKTPTLSNEDIGWFD